MKFNLNNFLEAVSYALDFVEIDILGATSNHSRRVAYISLRLAECFKMNDEERFDLCSFAMLHDNGLSEEVFHADANTKIPINKRKHLEIYTAHCDIGEKNVTDYPFFTDQRDIIRYHHEKYDGTGFFGIAGNNIPLMAQIIALANTVDNLYHFETKDLENRKKIISYISQHKNSYYSPELVEALLETCSHTSFWLDLQSPFIFWVLKKKIPSKILDIPLEKIFQITRVFSKIIDSKSRFTYRHTSGLIEKTDRAADFYQFNQTQKTKLLIAAGLHDLGKLAVPNTILDKPGKLTEGEFNIIKTHTYYTAAALNQIDRFEDISRWAANHHETLDGTGYPYGIHGDDLGFEERLMACLDIYQALTEDRPYRKGMSNDRVMGILEKNAVSGKIDKMIVSDIGEIFA